MRPDTFFESICYGSFILAKLGHCFILAIWLLMRPLKRPLILPFGTIFYGNPSVPVIPSQPCIVRGGTHLPHFFSAVNNCEKMNYRTFKGQDAGMITVLWARLPGGWDFIWAGFKLVVVFYLHGPNHGQALLPDHQSKWSLDLQGHCFLSGLYEVGCSCCRWQIGDWHAKFQLKIHCYVTIHQLQLRIRSGLEGKPPSC